MEPTNEEKPAAENAPHQPSESGKERKKGRLSCRWKVVIAVLSSALATLLMLLLIYNLSSGRKRIEQMVQPDFSVADPQFTRAMGQLLGPPLLEGNRVTALINGDEIFGAMLEAIRNAGHSITFETYIYWSGEIGKKFADAFSERARAGVKVHVLLDFVGIGRMDQDYIGQMEEAGVEVEIYRPLEWYHLPRFNHRTHRKILVVDGRIGFTGGANIADEWLGDARSPEEWRDSHFRLEGPAVAQMQAAFNDNWIRSRASVLYGDDYFPALDPVGDQLAQVIISSPQGGSENVRLMYMMFIAAAQKNIRLSAAYFVPDRLAVETILEARRRGVEVEIILPGRKADLPVVRKASRALWGDLLEGGVKIYEYLPTMYHCKVFIVDDLWVSVGSTNFDNRSFRLNDEANLNVRDAEFAREQIETFKEDKTNSRLITFEEWQQRPWRRKALDWLASLIRLQL
jgi:cardiolipin synthase A/B